jgi:sec-independent protein translocase protein TatA
MTTIPVTPQLAFIGSPVQLLLILLIILVIFGAKKIPTMGKGLGEGLREFKKSLSGEEEEDVKDDSIKCDKCGTKFKTGTRFCSDCGQPLEKKIENQDKG